MCTKNKQQNSFDLTQDENVILDDIDTLMTETTDDNIISVAKRVILSANNNNERNAQMFMEHIGMNYAAPMDYKELSAKFNVSAERVRQVCANTRKKIRRNKDVTELLLSFAGWYYGRYVLYDCGVGIIGIAPNVSIWWRQYES